MPALKLDGPDPPFFFSLFVGASLVAEEPDHAQCLCRDSGAGAVHEQVQLHRVSGLDGTRVRQRVGEDTGADVVDGSGQP